VTGSTRRRLPLQHRHQRRQPGRRGVQLPFSELIDGHQTATASHATGSHAQTREPAGDVLIQATPVGTDATATPVQAGPCRLFVGKRSDPFFADADGVLHWLIDGAKGSFQWTGTDTFAGANIFSIALEAPNHLLGGGPSIGAWITTSLRRDGTLVPMDREGNPSFNPILNPNDLKDQFNATDPVDDVKNYLQPLSQTPQQHGYPSEEAAAAVPCCPTSCITTAPCPPTIPTAGS
jgi:hypothetical protein